VDIIQCAQSCGCVSAQVWSAACLSAWPFPCQCGQLCGHVCTNAHVPQSLSSTSFAVTTAANACALLMMCAPPTALSLPNRMQHAPYQQPQPRLLTHRDHRTPPASPRSLSHCRQLTHVYPTTPHTHIPAQKQPLSTPPSPTNACCTLRPVPTNTTPLHPPQPPSDCQRRFNAQADRNHNDDECLTFQWQPNGRHRNAARMHGSRRRGSLDFRTASTPALTDHSRHRVQRELRFLHGPSAAAIACVCVRISWRRWEERNC
jgi:hypothetical protein